jgi:hypothetical protein
MHTAVRPWAMSGVALVGASVIAVTPVAPMPEVQLPRVSAPEIHMPAVQLTASIAEIFTFPAFRQYILNQIDDLVTLGVGVAQAGAGLGQSIALLPETLVTVTQQVLARDLLGALTTIETYLVGSVVAVGEPLLDAIIERRQRYLAVAEAMQQAVPEAIIELATGFGQAVDVVLRAFIVAGQDLVDSLLPLDLGNVVNALVQGTQLVLGSFVDGGQDIVDGIVAAQQTIATALATQPTTVALASSDVESAAVTDLPDLSRTTAALTLDSPTTVDVDSAQAADETQASAEVTADEPTTTPAADPNEQGSTPVAEAASTEAATDEDSTPAEPSDTDTEKPDKPDKPSNDGDNSEKKAATDAAAEGDKDAA